MPAVPNTRFAWPAATAQARWSTFGPYYAMFPVSFVRDAIERFCPHGSAVLDPFCGRGTVPYVARITGRPSLGVDLNAVAYVFSAAKTDPEPELAQVLLRIAQIGAAVGPADSVAVNAFQQLAWAPRVLGFLNAARRELEWRGNRLDRTLMALILVHLHAKKGNAVSNQMRQSKSMAPDYAVRWWTARNLTPPDLDPVKYFAQRAIWRYRYGIPVGPAAQIEHGDARSKLINAHRRFSLLLTSPPYCGVTNYRVDNWIRLWMLGEGDLPTYASAERYGSRARYTEMLRTVFAAAKRLLYENATVFVRTDSRAFTRDTTRAVLEELWPDRQQFTRTEQVRQSQTNLFGDKTQKPGETDILLLAPDSPPPSGFLPDSLSDSPCTQQTAELATV